MAFITKKELKKIWKNYKEGIIVGAITGLIAANYAIGQGYDLVAVAEAGKGLLDSLMTRSAPVELATYKLYGAFMFIGASIGLLADKIITDMGKK